MMNNMYDGYTLNNGLVIPCTGFGTYKAGNSDAIKIAVEAGYRYFDTASFYKNEAVLGQIIKDSHIPREEFFLVSKVWKEEMGYENTLQAFQKSLNNLQTEYLDLYLIHWPRPVENPDDWKSVDIETWKALEELYLSGRVKAIGLSNFLPHHIENILEHSTISPMVDQIEFHPGYSQEATVAYCQERNIVVQAWSPIGRRRMFEHPIIIELASKYKVSKAQLCLRFAVQRGIIPLPKSSALERMKENQDLFSFEISKEDMYRLATMPQAGWSGEHPDLERVEV